MIAELADGRSFELPDDMNPASISGIVRALLAAEKSAADALAKCERMQERMDAMQSKMDDSQHDSAELAELQKLHALMSEGFARMTQATLADRVLVADETGERTRSRAVMPNSKL